jgi:hypothetical protein
VPEHDHVKYVSERPSCTHTEMVCFGRITLHNKGKIVSFRRVAVWVAVRCRSAQFTEVRTPGLTRGMNACEPCERVPLKLLIRGSGQCRAAAMISAVQQTSTPMGAFPVKGWVGLAW